jgi:hypothetical protein
MICKLEIYNGELNLFPVVTNERVFAQITMGNIVKGQPGVTPHIDPETKHWMVGIEDTNVVAEGKNGLVPHVGENGNWFIGEEDTRVKAQGKDGPSITFIELSSSNEGVTNVDYHDFHSDVLSGKGIMLLYNGEYTMVSNIVISEGILPHYDAYFFNNYDTEGIPHIRFYWVRFYHSGISGDNRLHYMIIDPLGTTIYHEYNLSLKLGETGIEVGMNGKYNYEEVISYNDLKSKLGL